MEVSGVGLEFVSAWCGLQQRHGVGSSYGVGGVGIGCCSSIGVGGVGCSRWVAWAGSVGVVIRCSWGVLLG